MGMKSILKSVFGEQRLSEFKGQIMHYVTSAELMLKNESKLSLDTSVFQVAYYLQDEGYHVFRGYYDLRYLSDDGTRFLTHRLPVGATNNRKTKIEIGYYDLKEKQFRKVTESSAWCWQQGSRLRWHPKDQEKIIFNDVDKKGYCTRIANARTGVEEGRIERALYDIASDFSWGISLNYSRLQRKRHGYGYSYFEDETIGQNMPADDGIFLVDMERNVWVLKYSLQRLAQIGNIPTDRECYINHVSIAPDDKKYIFFLIHTKPGVKGWGTVLYLVDREKDELQILEEQDRVSHYCWIGNEQLMVTCHCENGTEYYCIFDVVSGKKTKLEIRGLFVDGHPSPYMSDTEFITDTYPQSKGFQEIRLFDLNDKDTCTVASIYHDYRLRGEKRCDLHPSVEDQGRFISIDTTYKDGKRSVLILGNKELIDNGKS